MPVEITEPSCGDCVYFIRKGDANDLVYGECHRNPPVTFAGRVWSKTEFPSTFDVNWCGEHKYRKHVP